MYVCVYFTYVILSLQPFKSAQFSDINYILNAVFLSPLFPKLHHPQHPQTLYSLSNDFSFPSPAALGNLILLSASMDFPILHTSSKCNHITLVFLCLADFTYHNGFKVQPHCSICQNVIVFHDSVVLYIPCILHFLYLSHCWWILRIFFIFCILWMLLQWTQLHQYLFKSLLSILWLYITQSSSLGQYGSSVFNFLRNGQSVFIVAAPFYKWKPRYASSNWYIHFTAKAFASLCNLQPS